MSDDLVAWLRRAVEIRQALARDLIESEAASAEWHELSSGVLVTGPSTVDDAWEGTHALGDSRLTRFMEAHDPRDTIARCEAELAILDWAVDVVQRYGEDDPAGRMALHCVRLLGSGYRFRPGYLPSDMGQDGP